ncbi:MAG: hypothetical protein MR522_02025 [Trueperella sp.]|uniref:carbamoyl-phosphate synthase domain-containing protein n=1 Tax=Trueperella TaxID=1069494 RepID=UPI0025F2EE23|nr:MULTISPECIES: carbamoyl-phosphate synthase domain-containing protein [Trueperella]MCI7305035.1 hypothetical protein [Trueperella sp.]
MSQAKIIFEDGTEFPGRAYGAPGEVNGRVVVCTSATGYEPALADDANADAIVLYTTPHIGNTGMTGAEPLVARGLIARDPVPRSSSAFAVAELEQRLSEDGVVGICEVDTRAIMRRVRAGAATVTIVTEEN